MKLSETATVVGLAPDHRGSSQASIALCHADLWSEAIWWTPGGPLGSPGKTKSPLWKIKTKSPVPAEHRKNYGKSPCSMGTLPISMAMFNSELFKVTISHPWLDLGVREETRDGEFNAMIINLTRLSTATDENYDANQLRLTEKTYWTLVGWNRKLDSTND